MADSQPQQAAGGQQPQQPQLLRADDMLKLQCLPDDEKQKYRLIMMNFWNMTQEHAAGSPEHTNARQKLTEWSQKFIYRERQYRAKLKQQQQQQGNQGQSGQGNQAPLQNHGQVKQEQSQGAPTTQQPQAQQQTQPQPQHQAQQQQQQQQQQAGAPANSRPAAMNPSHEADAKIKEYRNGYLNLLVKQATCVANRSKLNTEIGERQKAGLDIPQEMIAMRQRVEKEHAQFKDQIDKFRIMQKQWKQERDRKQSQSQDQASAQSPQQPQVHQQPQRQPSQGNIPAQPQVKEEPQIKVEGGQVPQPQPAPQFNLQGNQQPLQNMQVPHSLQQQQGRPPPAPHSQSMPPNQVQSFQQQQPHLQQNRPQINPHQANNHQHQNSNSPHPQSATSNAPGGPPYPLSHQAAVSAANLSYTDPQRTNTPLQQGGQGNFGSREREQLNNPKMPIPRHLNVSSPAPVHMGQARPTMSGPTNGAPGPMGQPVIPRPPPFQLEGEGDRVLSKRKLDELVRQVTGGSEEALTSEVEEAVLQLADDFVDNVISSACKLSKLRESPQLDIRDIQLILERNYNIRIPGYASDEVRTVRKIVPAAGWVDKMKAVNAAKVMGGKADF
ncbi:transcription initiation factor TFIID subunit A-domain-containing protein [Phaeosphaeriaceae sp. PMI808]|nr:transcription initiation factor TFIID subunit A-domain-containing protein [Phaeosphaeriaceae sp. PMI808]